MMNENTIVTFTHTLFGDLRIVDQNGNTWFVATDVAKALGYERPNDAIHQHCRKVNKINYGVLQHGLNIIPESDLYRLIMRSQLESAEKFHDWVVEEVLPSIRKTGGYKIGSSTQAAEEMPKIAAILEASKKIAAIMGLDENHQVLKANQITRQQTGYDCMKEFDIQALEYKPNIQYHTPSVLGDMCGVSAVKMNKILEEKGLQKETRDNRNRLVWTVTEKGKEYSRLFDTSKTKKDGLPVQQIKWSEKVVDII